MVLGMINVELIERPTPCWPPSSGDKVCLTLRLQVRQKVLCYHPINVASSALHVKPGRPIPTEPEMLERFKICHGAQIAKIMLVLEELCPVMLE